MDPGSFPVKQLNVCRRFELLWRRLAVVCRYAFISCCLSLIPLLNSSALAIVTDSYDVNLRENKLHQSLVDLGRQTDSSIIFSAEMPNRPSPAVRGRLTVVEAAALLIEGQDLEYIVAGPQTLVVLPRCFAARSCRAMHHELSLSTQQYPVIEELIVRGEPVTGSRFKQLNVNGFTPVEILTSTEIRLTGAQTMAELMRFTPEVVGNSTSTAVSNGGNGMASVTLRGLPANNTLVLVNGQRVAPNALDGSSVDLNSIPLAAVDRIEILKDSGSSIYGSDAIAGVVNVILKKRFQGAIVNAFYGGASVGDNETQRYDLVAGTSFAGLDLMVTASHYQQRGFFSRDRAISASADGRSQGGQDNRSSATPNTRLLVGNQVLTLAADDLRGQSTADFTRASASDLFDFHAFTSSLVPAERNSLHLVAEVKELGSLDATFDLTYVDSNSQITLAPSAVLTAFTAVPISIAADNRYNPFTQEIKDARIRLLGLGPRLQGNTAKTVRANSRLMGNLRDGEWQLSLNWSRADAQEHWQNLVDLQHLALGLGSDEGCAASIECVPINVFAPAQLMPQSQLNYLRAQAINRGQSELWSVNLDFSQRVDIVPAGDVELASGLEFRRETLRTQADPRLISNQLVGGQFASTAGSQNSLEMYFESLVPLVKAKPGIFSLEANGSFRLTHSNSFGLRANPKLALRYRPIQDLVLRASLSLGFRAPSLFELFQSQSGRQTSVYDPCSGDISGLSGCVATTDPLRKQYWLVTGGNADLQPEKSKNVALGFVFQPQGLQNFTLGLDFFAMQVDQVIGVNSQYLVDQSASSNLFQSQVIRDARGEIIQILANNQNFGSREIQGVDLDLAWRLFIAKWGTFGVNLGGAYIDSYEFSPGSNAAATDLAGTFVDRASEGNGSIPEWKSQLNLFWQFGRWELALSSLHVSSLTEYFIAEDRTRDSGAWSREDMQLSYHFNSGESLVTLGIENVFAQMPPFLGTAFNDNFDVRTHDSTGRFIYARLSHRL